MNNQYDINKNNAGRLRLKRVLFRCGLFGFVGGLVSFVLLMMLNVPMALFEAVSLFQGFDPFSGFMSFLFFVPFVSFAILIASLVMKPGKEDFAADMAPDIIIAALIIIAGVALGFLVPLVSLGIFMIARFIASGEIFMLAIGYFLFSGLFFALSGCYVMVRTLLSRREVKEDGVGEKGLKGIFRQNFADKTEDEIIQAKEVKMRRRLTGIEKWISVLLGIGIVIIFEWDDIVSLLRLFSFPGKFERLLEALTFKSAGLSGISVFIMIFSSMMIVKSLKVLYSRK